MSVPITFKNLVIISLALIGVGIYIFTIKLKDKESFEKISGYIIYLDDSFQELPRRHKGKYRYIALDTYPYIIQIFIGKDFGDFGPKFEQIDKLKLGDFIVVYYESSSKISQTGINKTVQFIDYNGKSFYEAGSGIFYVGGFVIIISFSLIPLGYYWKKKGKIE